METSELERKFIGIVTYSWNVLSDPTPEAITKLAEAHTRGILKEYKEILPKIPQLLDKLTVAIYKKIDAQNNYLSNYFDEPDYLFSLLENKYGWPRNKISDLLESRKKLRQSGKIPRENH